MLGDTKMPEQSPEDYVKGLRRRGGHLPTKVSEAERKRKEAAAQERQNQKQGYEVLDWS